ncbi:pyruvate kinase [Flagellimonas zhangzhouensis]|uniref:pyruvate kinase n=1 Tax=Flagellimonas zhangzhouensis TaxID=1073328 RepID=A0A1H2VMA5_9FLAO|nr:pyruvate kinase [Allomuricauda zhangzhouensis]SDQ06892.1 pyruvate kinase [Allomuricauda zhangzhouensis]SDW69453.1 pyruvate kinase [Allomuricauda zhangzhouensis]
MGINKEQLQTIALRIDEVIGLIQKENLENHALLDEVCPSYKKSAQNLSHYAAFRGFDARSMQKELKHLGLTRLANSEGNILGSLINLKEIVHSLLGDFPKSMDDDFLNIGEGKKLLQKHTDYLFGESGNHRRVRIMVTQPSEAANNYDLVLDMVKGGMDCARVNCAHDHPEVWKKIIENVRKAEEECGIKVKVAMDLSGPKIRTGDIVMGPKIKRFKAPKDQNGVRRPAIVKFVPASKSVLDPLDVPVDEVWLKQLQVGDDIKTKDCRGKSHKIKVVKILEDGVLLENPKTIYLETETILKPKRAKLGETQIGELPPVEQSILVREGDVITVTGEVGASSLPKFDAKGNLVHPGVIGCIPAQIVERVKVGDRILFDDGKISGEVETLGNGTFQVKITRAKEGGAMLKAEKGINLPALDLGISGLTEKDREDLKFVVQHADIVNVSYVNSEADVVELLSELESLGAKPELGVILKIETQSAYKNLIGILLTAMQRKHLGVMIARGDLALEVGWKNMGMVQEGILSFCSAAHIPVVWATQVLESLAKKGLPFRSEITDITSSVQAECVMLNKGPHINKAISFLHEVLLNSETSHDKKEVMLPKMKWD